MREQRYTEEEWRAKLTRQHDLELPELRALNRLYEGAPDMAYLHPELLAEIGDQLQQVVINWPRLVADSIEERLDVEGFRRPDTDEADEELWRIWQANGMDEQSQMAHVDLLVMKRSYLIVGTGEDESTPLVTAESPLQAHADFDPATRKVRAGIKRWNDTDPLTGAIRDQCASLYVPGATVYYEVTGAGTWREVGRDDHGVEAPLMVVLPNRGRLLMPGGVSELADVIPIAHAANKIATDMMVSAEYHAIPRRVAFGFDEKDFVGPDGKPVSKWSRIAGRIWATARRRGGEDGADVIQFPEAQLANFHTTIELLARLTSALSALPPNYLGLAADDAASADAIRSREARLVKRCERKQRPLSGGYERMSQLVMRIRDGSWDPALQQLETLWRDPSTPTVAQTADAVVKKVQAGIIPVEQAREDLGYTAGQRARMRLMDDGALDRLLRDQAAGYGPKELPGPVEEIDLVEV
ncbi:phage portal protein [Streptomyces harbinensis]|uniref:phage portal protein n=1 Tax=Streptomyces harbinensis TaxID=1176198 RepID=UPI0036A085D9